jgi:hypothetical protein
LAPVPSIVRPGLSCRGAIGWAVPKINPETSCNDQVTAIPAIRLAENSQADTPAELCCRKLKELSDRLDQFHALGKGQFVKWKSGLKNRKFPDYGEPAIVTAVLPSPIFDPSEVSWASPYFQEPLSIIIGADREDDFLEFRVDGRRFEPFES